MTKDFKSRKGKSAHRLERQATRIRYLAYLLGSYTPIEVLKGATPLSDLEMYLDKLIFLIEKEHEKKGILENNVIYEDLKISRGLNQDKEFLQGCWHSILSPMLVCNRISARQIRLCFRFFIESIRRHYGNSRIIKKYYIADRFLKPDQRYRKSINNKELTSVFQIDQRETIKALKDLGHDTELFIRKGRITITKKDRKTTHRILAGLMSHFNRRREIRNLLILSNFNRSLPILTERSNKALIDAAVRFTTEPIKSIPEISEEIERFIKEKILAQLSQPIWHRLKRMEMHPRFNVSACIEKTIKEGGTYEFFRQKLIKKRLRENKDVIGVPLTEEVSKEEWWDEVIRQSMKPKYSGVHMKIQEIRERGGKERILSKTSAPTSAILTKVNDQCIAILKEIPGISEGFKLHSLNPKNQKIGVGEVISRLTNNGQMKAHTYYESDCSESTDWIHTDYAKVVIATLAKALRWTKLEEEIALKTVSPDPVDRSFEIEDKNIMTMNDDIIIHCITTPDEIEQFISKPNIYLQTKSKGFIPSKLDLDQTVIKTPTNVEVISVQEVNKTEYIKVNPDTIDNLINKDGEQGFKYTRLNPVYDQILSDLRNPTHAKIRLYCLTHKNCEETLEISTTLLNIGKTDLIPKNAHEDKSSSSTIQPNVTNSQPLKEDENSHSGSGKLNDLIDSEDSTENKKESQKKKKESKIDWAEMTEESTDSDLSSFEEILVDKERLRPFHFQSQVLMQTLFEKDGPVRTYQWANLKDYLSRTNTKLDEDLKVDKDGAFYSIERKWDTNEQYIHIRIYQKAIKVTSPIEEAILSQNGIKAVRRELIQTRDKHGKTIDHSLKLIYPQTQGTQMGLRLSFVVLCILHWFAVNKAGDPRQACIFGDDLCSNWSEATINEYLIVMKKLGFKMNPSKEFRSSRYWLFCGTYFDGKKLTSPVFPELKSVLGTKTDTSMDKEFDVYLRIKEVNNTETKKCTSIEKKPLQKLVKDLYHKELAYVAKKLPLHTPEIYGGFGLLPFNRQQTVHALNLKLVYNTLSKENRIMFSRKIRSCWAKAVQDKELRELEMRFAEYCNNNTINPPRRYTGIQYKSTDEALSEMTVNLNTAVQYFVTDGRSKLNYTKQTVNACVARMYKRSRELYQEFIEPNDNSLSGYVYTPKEIYQMNHEFLKNQLHKPWTEPEKLTSFIDESTSEILNYILHEENLADFISLMQELKHSSTAFLTAVYRHWDNRIINKVQPIQDIQGANSAPRIASNPTLGDFIMAAIKKHQRKNN
jgi:hypothetical protein